MNPDQQNPSAALDSDRRSVPRRLAAFLWENKVWWITPTVLILAFLAVIVYYANGASIAPFFYSIF